MYTPASVRRSAVSNLNGALNRGWRILPIRVAKRYTKSGNSRISYALAVLDSHGNASDSSLVPEWLCSAGIARPVGKTGLYVMPDVQCEPGPDGWQVSRALADAIRSAFSA